MSPEEVIGNFVSFEYMIKGSKKINELDDPSTSMAQPVAFKATEEKKEESTSSRQPIDASKLKRGFSNPVTLAVSFIFLLDSITVLAISFFLPTIIRTIYPGRSVIQQQLLTVPPYIVAVVCTILITAVSWRMNSRQTLIALAGLFVAVGYAIFLATMNASVRYAAVFLCASTCFSLGAMTNAQVSANVLSDSARSIAIGTNVFFGYVGALIATWTYLPGDSPRYAIGNGLNLGCAMTW